MTQDFRLRLMTLATLHQFANFKTQILMADWQRATTFDELAEMIWP
jgi:hypothetical protein